MRSKHIFWMMIALAIGMIIGASRGALAQTGDERADQWARENPELALITEWVAELEDQIYELQQEVRALEQEVEDCRKSTLACGGPGRMTCGTSTISFWSTTRKRPKNILWPLRTV